jgi:hypothetical protein
MEKVIELCQKYNINIIQNNYLYGCATGIGDILFRILCMKNNQITKNFYINLHYFTQPYYMSEPINQLEFRIKLIHDLLKSNNIPFEKVIFIYSTTLRIDCDIDYKNILCFNLNLTKSEDSLYKYKETPNIDYSADYDMLPPKNYIRLKKMKAHRMTIQTTIPVLNMSNIIIENSDRSKDLINEIKQEYIIFHTKCRHTKDENYELLKNKIKQFCENYKSKYTIIIMGEQIFPVTEESIGHGITTVYDELKVLEKNNKVVDLTINNIYNNLNYENYYNDVKLMKNAKYNIIFGRGGPLCTSIIFGKSTIFYYKSYPKYNELNDDNLKNNNHFHYENIDELLNKLDNI